MPPMTDDDTERLIEWMVWWSLEGDDEVPPKWQVKGACDLCFAAYIQQRCRDEE